MARTYKEAGQPLPQFSEDDVINYQVTEAVVMARLRAEKEAMDKHAEEERVREWREKGPGSGPPKGR